MSFLKKADSYFLWLSFIGGVCITGVEVMVSRLVAPYFGTSLLVWNSILGAILMALSIGHYVGGRIADREVSLHSFARLMLYTSIYIACIPFVAKYLFAIALQGINSYLLVRVAFASVLLVLVLVLPFVSLGMMKPYAIKLKVIHSPGMSMGRASGIVFMLFSIGSLLSILLSTFVLTPLFGAYRGMLIFSALLMLISVLNFNKRFWFLLPACPILLTIFPFKVKPEQGLVYETESVYNYIQVFKDNSTFTLRLNEGHATHSFYNPDVLISFGEWDYGVVLAFLNGGKSLLSLGLCCGTTARTYAHYVPGAAIDGVEIDPAISKVAERFFGLKDIPNLNVINQDARLYLITTSRCYDNIIIDAYKQPYIPFHLTTEEFFQEVRRHLNPRGIVGINVGATEEDSQVLLMIQNTMRAVFNYVYTVRMYNQLQTQVWASDFQIDMASVDIDALDARAVLLFEYIRASHVPVIYDPNCIILKDDLAPVECYTERMIIDFAKKEAKTKL